MKLFLLKFWMAFLSARSSNFSSKFILFNFPVTAEVCAHSVVSSSLQPYGLSSPPDYSVRGISQARILEWVAISFSSEYSWPRDWTHVSCIIVEFLIIEPPGKPVQWHKEMESDICKILFLVPTIQIFQQP